MGDKYKCKEWEFDLKEFKNQYKENDYYSLREKATMKLKVLLFQKTVLEKREIIFNMKNYYQYHIREEERINEALYSLLIPIIIFLLSSYMTYTFTTTDKSLLEYALYVIFGFVFVLALFFIKEHFLNHNKKAYYQFYYEIIEQFEIELEKSFVSDSKTDKNSNKRKKNKKRKKST